MKKRFLVLAAIFLAAALILGACKPKTAATETSTVAPSTTISTTQPAQLKGEFTYTNSIIETYYVEQAVMLTDMHGFVVRDLEWQLPVESQVLGFLSLDTINKDGTYSLSLPAIPLGTFNDVDNNGKTDKGVQIFAVAYSPNLTGGPFSEGDDKSYGWPGYLASVVTDSENHEEVISGKLVVWSPDDKQQFPTAFGADGKLFTADDPVGPIPGGYSIVDLDTNPFTISRDEVSTLKLYEPKDVAIKDFSKDTYVDAFQKMFDFVKTEYAFNGVEGKQPDWDKVYAKVKPEVQAAQDAKDSKAFYLALRDFTYAFNDGHVGLSGGDVENKIFSDTISNGYGFAIRQLDDGSVMVNYVTAGGPAEKAGIEVGAVVTQFNGQPIEDAVKAVVPLTLPASMQSSILYQQARYLLRAPAGTVAKVTFTNPGGTEQTVDVTSVPETDSYRYTSIMKGYDYTALPVEYRIIPSQFGNIGYVKINSNYDDLNLIIRLFERALKTFNYSPLDGTKVAGMVIDMRQNSGGANLGLAGFLTDKEIPMGLLEYYSTKTGQFEPEGVREKVLPNVNQYRFDKEVVLVDQACASACELEAYGFSQVPGMEVMGTSPSSGTEAEVSRGQIYLPDGFFLQVPTGRFKLPDGSIFLEGKGVQLTYHIPVDQSLVLSQSADPVLDRAIGALMAPKGAGITPSGDPTIANAEDTKNAMNGNSVKYLEQLAPEKYNDTLTPGKTYSYTIDLGTTEQALWLWGWCAKDKATTDQNFSQINLTFSLNGKGVSPDKVTVLEGEGSGMYCRYYGMLLENWPGGEHHLEMQVTFKSKINDGSADYQPGTMTYDYTVYVTPK